MSGKVVYEKNANDDERIQIVRSALKSYNDFPKPGIIFQDIFAVFSNPSALEALFGIAKDFSASISNDIDVIVGLDSRGFLFGPIMANFIGKPFVPARKAGKLPGVCVNVEYSLEYGSDKLEIQQDSIKQGGRVLIVDDLLATGGTMAAAVDLVKKVGGEVVSCWVVMELAGLQGRDKVDAPLQAVIQL